MAFNCSILHCKAGSNDRIQGDWVSAIYYLANMGVDIISMSFFGSVPSVAAQDAINYAYNTKGCIIVACAGFTGDGTPHNNYTYPASYDNVISASILENDATHMRLNSYVNDKVDVLTSRTYTYPSLDINGNPTYGSSMHSSGATAVTAGLTALLKSHYPSWTNEMIINQILLTCSSRDDQNRAGSNQYGFDFYGLIGNGLDNAYKTLTFNGTINENTIWAKKLKIYHNVVVNSGKTLTLRPGTNLEFQNNKTFNVYGSLVIQGDLTINQDINVMQGGSISIQSGATLQFAAAKSLVVNGTLNVQGTSSNPITFDFISPNSSTQNGIKINNGGDADISHAIIKNAYSGISIITPVSGSPSIENTEIKNCYNGIVIQYGNKDADITIANNIIIDNTNYGISIANPDHYGMNVEPSAV